MKHNKKRNIGLIYELFLRHMSKCIVEDDKRKLKIATNVVSKNFDKKKIKGMAKESLYVLPSWIARCKP